MLLEGKNAVIYGGGGKVGGAVARAFAREGANVFLAGRTLTTLDEVAGEITAAGGVGETAQVGPSGIRVNCLRSEGIPESWEGASTEDWSAPTEEVEAFLKERSLLGRVTMLADVGNAAAFLASDLAAATTGIVFNLTSGTVVD